MIALRWAFLIAIPLAAWAVLIIAAASPPPAPLHPERPVSSLLRGDGPLSPRGDSRGQRSHTSSRPDLSVGALGVRVGADKRKPEPRPHRIAGPGLTN